MRSGKKNSIRSFKIPSRVERYNEAGNMRIYVMDVFYFQIYHYIKK